MSRTRSETYFYYPIMLVVFALGMWLIIASGSKLKPTTTNDSSLAAKSTQTATQTTTSQATETPTIQRSPLSVLLLQIIVIIVVAKLFGAVFRRIGQPPVMGEMVAGIALGPSVLGWLSPQTMTFLFPLTSMTTLGVFSQVGVVLFMFIVGMELDLEHLKERASSAIMVSHASIVVPFLLGSGLALALYPTLAPPDTAFMPFALFIGIAMSITAFPVLARILKDRELTQSPLGTTALACAAIGDVTAWCILAFVVALANATGFSNSLLTVGFTILFTIALLIAKPWLERFITRLVEKPERERRAMAATLAFALSCAWITETIGIHALFGGFLAGVVVPSNATVQNFLREKIEPFSSAALLPLFFIFTGLRTQITLLNDWNSWLMCAGIILVAIVGKLGGTMFMARWTKMSWRDSFAIGALMNTRGLMELVVLNIGYDLGILSAKIFVMMVIMALATTFMTAPLLSLVKVGKH